MHRRMRSPNPLGVSVKEGEAPVRPLGQPRGGVLGRPAMEHTPLGFSDAVKFRPARRRPGEEYLLSSTYGDHSRRLKNEIFPISKLHLLQRQLWIWIHLSALDEGIIATCCVDVPEALKSTEGKVQFLMECLGDLKQSMRKRGPHLPILHDAFEAHSLNMLFQEDLCHATLARCRPSPVPLATAAGGSCLAATGDRTWGTLS